MKKRKIFYCALIALFFLLIATKCSPLYKINDWYDANAFFTMGKSWLNGRIPYLHLFEQKGPLLYLIYAIGALISNNSFLGIFILEVISFTIFLFFIDKIICLFTDEFKSYILIPILSLLILSSSAFYHGGSCEEFAFPMLAISFYHLIKYLKTNQISNKETLSVGIMTGLIFWTKYSLLGFHIGFCLIVLIKHLLSKKGKELLEKILYFLLGFLITSVPWLIYFSLYKNGLKSLIDVYFTFNMTSYAGSLSGIEKLKTIYLNIRDVLLIYKQYLVLIFIPILISIKSKLLFKKAENYIYLLIPIILELVLLFTGQVKYHYYSLPIQPFMIIGLIFIILLLEKLDKKKLLSKYFFSLSIIIITICFLGIFKYSPNIKDMTKSKSDYAQFRFSELIEPNKTILNYRFLDGGFYLTTNTIPNVYYFQKNNVKYELYPYNVDSQKQYIREKQVDYIIARSFLREKDKEMIEKNYRLISEYTQSYEGRIKTYYLYKKK